MQLDPTLFRARRICLPFGDKLERSHVIGRNLNRACLEIEAGSFDKRAQSSLI